VNNIQLPRTFEDMYHIIDLILKKRRGKWRLKAIAWLDFEDIEQIIKIHIFKKWHLWDQARALEPWLNKLISNQFRNILRNNYTSFVKPCLNNCKHNLLVSHDEQDSAADAYAECSLTPSGLQCRECPLYAKWEKGKKNAYNIKMTLPLDDGRTEDGTSKYEGQDYISAETRLHQAMKDSLSDKHFFIYKMFFIDCMSDEEIAQILQFKTNEKGRKAGYKQIKNLKNMLRLRAEKILKTKDLFNYQ